MLTGAGSHRKETAVSVIQPLPHQPNLTNLRKQAKALLVEWRADDPRALARVREFHPRGERLLADGRSSLADAQLVVARGYGFASWARLAQHLRLTPQAQAGHIVDRLFQATLAPGGQSGTVGQVLRRRVDLLWQAHLDGNPAVAVFLRTAGADGSVGEMADRTATVEDVREAVARAHGFAAWAAVSAERDRPVEPRFESAVDAIVSGDPDTLRTLLDAHPGLVATRSPFGHHATLVHYVAANGVEPSRQWQTPRNAVEILRILLGRGADPDAPCDAYGGRLTPLCALVSSAHPAAAGVEADLVEELCGGGANPDGLDEDGLPLWTAITCGHVDAVDALARCGARVDNLVFAAAVGDLSGVAEYLRGDRPRRAERVGRGGPVLDPNHMIEYALIYAAGLGRRAVVGLLLARRPDLSVSEPVFHSTAAGMARYHQRHDLLALLDSR
jgi:hypothetical protein